MKTVRSRSAMCFARRAGERFSFEEGARRRSGKGADGPNDDEETSRVPPRERRFTGWGLSLGVVSVCCLGACTAPRGPVPADLQARAVELPVERNDGWQRLFGPPLRIDEYTVRDLTVGEEGGPRRASRSVRFASHRRGALLWRVRCRERKSQGNSGRLRCEARADGSKDWALRVEWLPDGWVEGRIDWKDGTFALAPTTRPKADGPTSLLIGANEVPILLIDVRGDGTVWMADDLAADVRDVLVSATAALLLSEGPGD